MDRKALGALIVILSSLVILALVHFNQPATAPSMPPTVHSADMPATPPSAMLNLTGNMTALQNGTITPTPAAVAPTISSHSPPPHTTLAPSPAQNTLQPTPVSAWGPMAAMTPWPRMPAWTPMPPASPLTGSSKLR